MTSETPRRFGLLRAFAWSIITLLGLPAATTGFGADSARHYEVARMSMACLYAIEAYAPQSVELEAAAKEALDEVDRIDRLMSHYKPDSPLSEINREAATHPVRPPRELFDFIAESVRYSSRSSGAFDITVGPLMKAWGFFRGDGRMPSSSELGAAARLVGVRHLRLDAEAGTVAFDAQGVELDLGGIAKGYAIDRAVRVLRARGVTAALVSAGGSTVYGIGSATWRRRLGRRHSGSARFAPQRDDGAAPRSIAVDRRPVRERVRGRRRTGTRTSWTRGPAARFRVC